MCSIKYFIGHCNILSSIYLIFWEYNNLHYIDSILLKIFINGNEFFVILWVDAVLHHNSQGPVENVHDVKGKYSEFFFIIIITFKIKDTVEKSNSCAYFWRPRVPRFYPYFYRHNVQSSSIQPNKSFETNAKRKVLAV